MTTAIATVSGSVLSGEPPHLNPAHPLAWELEPDLNPDPGSKVYSPAVRESARQFLAVLEPFAAPVSEEALLEWLDPIPLAVRNEKTPEALAGWLAAVVLGVGKLESGAFTPRTQETALRTFQFFPAVADIAAVVMPAALAIRSRITLLRIIAREPAP